MIEFFEDENTEMITSLFSTDDMLDNFVEVGLLPFRTGDYGLDVMDMCNNATAVFGTFYSNMFGDIAGELKVHEGVFNMTGNHTWLSVGGLIIDLTLAQFYSGAPKIAFCSIDTPEYQAVKTYDFHDWLKAQI